MRSYFDGGKIRPLIFFYSHRLNIPQFANVPVSKEFGYDVTLPQFRAIVVKAGTDPQRVKVLGRRAGEGRAEPDFKDYLDQQYADPDSYVPMDKARPFMDSWLAQAKGILASMQTGRSDFEWLKSVTTCWSACRATLPYMVVLAAGAFLYYAAENFEFEEPAGRIGPGAWPKLILVLDVGVGAVGRGVERGQARQGFGARKPKPMRPRR